jgi:chromosome segregation ATPase
VVGKSVKFYKDLDRADQQGGGGLTLATVVKVAGWTGLIAVLAVLVGKLRDIEKQLDPVASSVQKLQVELDAARGALAAQTKASQEELARLRLDAATLRAALGKSAEDEKEIGPAVQGAGKDAKALSEKLQQDLAAAEQMTQRRTALLEALDAYAKAIRASGDRVAGSADKATGETRALEESLARAQEKTLALERAIAALPVSGAEQRMTSLTQAAANAQASLQKVDAAALDLAKAIESATKKAKALDSRLERGNKLGDGDTSGGGDSK